eukprot:530760_1
MASEPATSSKSVMISVPTSSSTSTSNLLALGKISPMHVLRRLPSASIDLISDKNSKNDIDDIENKCDKKILVILMESHNMIEFTTLSEYILNHPDFQHISLPSIQIMDTSEFNKLSNDNNSQIFDYIKLAKLIEKYYFDFDGFVIIENLGKLAYASSYLSFMLENLSKPVVMTSSTTKLDHAFNDAKSNLISSFIIAGRTNINEVCVCFDYNVYRGNRVIRHDQSSHSAFSSPNMKPLAKFGTALVINTSLLLPTPKRGFRVFTKMFTDIMVLYITPCTNFLLLKYLLCDKKKKGIVISFYGAGNAPQSNQLKNIFKQCIEYGCNIVIGTQCLKGHVNMSVYATGNSFHGIGLIGGGDMTVEACVTKLSYLMGKGLTGVELRNKFHQSIIGEITPMHKITGRIVVYKHIKGDHHGINKFVENENDINK